MYFIFCHLFILPGCSACTFSGVRCLPIWSLTLAITMFQRNTEVWDDGILIRCTHTHQSMQLHCTMWIRADWGPGQRDDDERWRLGRCPFTRFHFPSLSLFLLKYTETRTQPASSPHHTVSRIDDGDRRVRERSLPQANLSPILHVHRPVIGQVKRVWKFNFQCFCLGIRNAIWYFYLTWGQIRKSKK